MTITILMLIAGFVLLVAGADVLVRGAASLAAIVGLSPLVIGLTVVAFGTSAPEMAVSVVSSWSGSGDLALGNVVGSNIFNILLILGCAAMITPLFVSAQLVRLDVPIMILASFVMVGLGLDGLIGRIDGAILFSGALAYTGFLIYQSRKESKAEQEAGNAEPPSESSTKTWLINLGFIALGLVLLVLGSDWLVRSATTIAKQFGVSDLIIGLTIVAAGTSLPEGATSVVASMRGERDIAVGNAIGSSIFNLLVVLGMAGLVAPSGIPVPDAALTFDIPVMIAVAIACLPIFASNYMIQRWEGGLFFGYYLAYTGYLILDNINSPYLNPFSNAMFYVVIPLTVITLGVMTVRSMQKPKTA